jgi:integrase
MAKVLTAAAIARYRPGKTRREIPDGGARGLRLIVQVGGFKSFALRFRKPGGVPAKLTLGPVDLTGKEMEGAPVIGQPLTLEAARQLAAEVHRQRAMGRDVVADHAAAKHRRKAKIAEGEANTFAAMAVRFVAEHARPKVRRWRANARILGLRYPPAGGNLEVIPRGLAERWADRAVREIDGHDIWAVVDAACRTGVPGLERRAAGTTDPLGRVTLAVLSSFFGWCLKHRRIEANPCVGIHKPGTSRPRDRVLDDREIAAFWRACDALGEPHGQMLKLLLLTGSRRSEVAGLSRAELSEDGATWDLPSSRTKNKRAHVVPLPVLVREIIASVKPIADADLVFTTNGRSPITGWSVLKHKLDGLMPGVAPWRIHDLRRSCVTGMAELGVRPDVIELCVNHVSGLRGSVAGIYNRSELLPERRAALERWAAHIEGIVSGRSANFVALRPAS